MVGAVVVVLMVVVGFVITEVVITMVVAASSSLCYFPIKTNSSRVVCCCLRSPMLANVMQKQQRSLSLCLSVSEVKSAPTTNRGSYNVVQFLTTNQMCGAGHLVGAFEFVCSNPDGADPKNPDIPCVDSSADDHADDDAQDTTSTTKATSGDSTTTPKPKAKEDKTTTEKSGEGSWGTSVHGSCLHALVCVVLLRVLLV